jgi:hypothetical protein
MHAQMMRRRLVLISLTAALVSAAVDAFAPCVAAAAEGVSATFPSGISAIDPVESFVSLRLRLRKILVL